MQIIKSLKDLDVTSLEIISLYLPKNDELVLRRVNSELRSKIDTSWRLWKNKRLHIELYDNTDLEEFIDFASNSINFKKLSSILIFNENELNSNIYSNIY